MTARWGPLGWMTLHSVSLIYPETPTLEEKMIATRFIQLFADCISCPACNAHFKSMLELYKLAHPDYLSSRQKFAMFVFRAHNTVNARLDKPRPQTVAECMNTLKIATSQTSFKEFRESYILYLFNNWAREMGGEASIIRQFVKELKRINDEFWNPRDSRYFPQLEEDDIITPIQNDKIRFSSTMRPINVDNIGFRGGRLKLMRR